MKTPWHQKYIKEPLEPDQDWSNRCKTVFLNACGSKFGLVPARAHSTAFFLVTRSLTSVAIAALMLSSISAYADQSNVGLRSTLYPLKRVYEKVELGLSSKERRDTIQIKHAVRRLEEARDSQATSPGQKDSAKLLTEARENTQQLLTVLNLGTRESSETQDSEASQTQSAAPVQSATPIEVMSAPVSQTQIAKPESASRKIETTEIPLPGAKSGGIATITVPEPTSTAKTEYGTDLKETARDIPESSSTDEEPRTRRNQEDDAKDIADKTKPSETSRVLKREKIRNIRICEQSAPLLSVAQSLPDLDSRTAAVINELDTACSNLEIDIKR